MDLLQISTLLVESVVLPKKTSRDSLHRASAYFIKTIPQYWSKWIWPVAIELFCWALSIATVGCDQWQRVWDAIFGDTTSDGAFRHVATTSTVEQAVTTFWVSWSILPSDLITYWGSRQRSHATLTATCSMASILKAHVNFLMTDEFPWLYSPQIQVLWWEVQAKHLLHNHK